jgi:hypothetical protein
MFEWCSMSVRSTSSPSRRNFRPQPWATRFSDSVVPRVKTTFAGSAAPMKPASFSRAVSNIAVASSAIS